MFVGSSQQTQFENSIRSQDSSSEKRTSSPGPLPETKMSGVHPELLHPLPQSSSPARPPLTSVAVNVLPSPAEIDTTPTLKRSRSRVLAGRRSPRERLVNGFHDDPSFVPETMKIAPSPSRLNPAETQEVPESPEKPSSTPVSPLGISTPGSQLGNNRDAPLSPVLRNGRGKCLKARRKTRTDGASGDDKVAAEMNIVLSSSGPGYRDVKSRHKNVPNSHSEKVGQRVNPSTDVTASRSTSNSIDRSLGASRQKVSPNEPFSDASRRRVSPNEPFSDTSRQRVSPNKPISDVSNWKARPSQLSSDGSRQKVSPSVPSSDASRLKVSPGEEISEKSKQKITSPSEEFSDSYRHRVGRIAPDVQSTIDKKAYQDLDDDFPLNKRHKQSRGVAEQEKKPTFLDDSANDFESPNLLRKTKSVGNREDEIEDFASPPACEGEEKPKNTEPNKLSKGASFKKPKMKKAENRWGIEVSELTESQSKRLKNQKQSKLDNFFGSKAKNNMKPATVKQINYTDSPDALQIALKLSKETFELEQQQMAGTSNHNSREPEPSSNNPRETSSKRARDLESSSKRVQDLETSSKRARDLETSSKRARDPPDELDFSPVKSSPSSPNYAYANAVVRKKDERKKLRGFDCRECEEYYKAKLEEGFTEQEVNKMMNDCSKHRGKYKPPLTPEKFWDPEIIEGDPESPRNKTQVQTKPLMNRARRRALNREKNKVKNLEKDDI